MPRKKAEPIIELTEDTAVEQQLTGTLQEETKQEEKEASASAPRRLSKYHNEVTLRGSIAKLIDAKTVTIVTLRTRATATISNYPTVMFFGANKEKLAGYKEGDRVEIKATINSYDEAKLKKGQSSILLSGYAVKGEPEQKTVVSADNVQPIEPACFNDFNMVDISGQILAIECDKNNDITLTIRTFTNSKVSVVKYPYYARSMNTFLKNVYVHQYIRAIGTVQTAQIPVEPEEEQKAETAINTLGENAPRPRIKTRKKQFYILYDVYPN